MSKRIDWHAGFAGGLELCLSRYPKSLFDQCKKMNRPIRISSAVNGERFEEVLKDEGVMSTIERLEQAREKALADSRAEGKAEGMEEGQLASIRSLMETMGMSAKDAMKALKISAANQKKFVAML